MRPAAIEWKVDHERRLLEIRLIGDVTGEMMLAEIPNIWAQHPEVIAYDDLIDGIAYTGTIEHSHHQAIAEAWRRFASGRERPKRVALLSMDPMTRMMAKVLAELFLRREFAVFARREAALEWLCGSRG